MEYVDGPEWRMLSNSDGNSFMLQDVADPELCLSLADSSGNDRTAVMTVYCNWDTLDVRHSEQSWELG